MRNILLVSIGLMPLFSYSENQTPSEEQCISQDFYEQFWQVNQSSDIPEAINSDNIGQQEFFQNITIKNLTGYGMDLRDNNDTKASLFYKIAGTFACYLPRQDCSYKNITKDKHVDDVMEVKQMIEAVEQCYANSALWENDGLQNSFGKRLATAIEKKLDEKCSQSDINNIILNAQNIVSYRYTAPDQGSPVNKVADDLKTDLQNIHSLLLFKFNDALAKLIISINQSQSAETEVKTFIDKNIINENEAHEIFDAYTEVISAKLASFPITVFSRNEINGDILSNGETKALDPNDAELVKNFRKTRALELENLNQQYIEAARSFGILKQAAISGLTSIVAERFKDKGQENSELGAISEFINKSLHKEDKSDEVNPVEILKQIRDNLALANRLKYKQYLAIERSQLALATTQMSQTKVLAERINTNAKSMSQMASLFDAGDNMTGLIGQKPDVQKLK